jgi:hypothetical protein
MASPFNRYNLGLFNSGTYTPTIVDIEDVSLSAEALVTTTIDHTFVIGQQVQFFIPPEWGMRQLQGRKGYVLSIPNPDEFVVNIDTTFFDVFVTPSPPALVVIDPAQVAGIGDQNTGTSSLGGIIANPNTIPGAYQNQPP